MADFGGFYTSLRSQQKIWGVGGKDGWVVAIAREKKLNGTNGIV